MEQKKTPRADLENRKPIFFLMGLVVAISAVFTAFEWGSRDIKINEIQSQNVFIEEEDIEITPPEENTPPPPPPPEAPAVADVINVVDDKIKLDNVEIMSVDDNLNKPQQVAFTPQVQQRREEPESDEIFEFFEESPEYPGGFAALQKFLHDKINYPAIAAENNIQGRVTVGFVVEKDGSVSDVKILKGVDPSLDKEAMRVVKLMPKWTPGKQTGKPVRCRYNIPVVFRLRN